MDAPVISAPDGDCVIGEAMDIAGENEKQKKGKDQAPDEEPVVSAAAKWWEELSPEKEERKKDD